MARNAPDPELIELVREAIGSGSTLGEVAEVAGVSKACVARWCKKYGMTPRTVAPTAMRERAAAAAVDDTPEPPPLELKGDASLADIVALQRDLVREANSAKTVGNYSAYQRSMRDAAGLVPVIARMKAAEKEGADVLHVSRSDLEMAHSNNRAKLRQLLERPLLCEHCGRALSVEWGEAPHLQPESTPAPAK